MSTWNESNPADGDQISLGAGTIRQVKTDIRERMDNEHTWTAAGDNTEGKHTEGSARITTDTAPPANVDDGRLYYDTINKLLKFANGSVFANLDMDAAQILAILGYKLASSTAAQVATSSWVTYISMSITKKEASSLLVIFGKVDLGIYGVTANAPTQIGIANGVSLITDSIATITAQTYNAGGATFTVVSGVGAGAQTINLQIKNDGINNATTSRGSLLVFELRNPFTL